MSLQEEPMYNLKAVVQQTGVKPDTLRAWERRYGLPEPRRSEGHHRLYSQRDINTIRWLLSRQREGLSISRAVELWQQLESDGRDPLDSTLPTTTPPAPAPPVATLGRALGELRAAWLAACLAYDERGAEQVLAEAFALYPPEVVIVELLQQGLSELGQGWYQGHVTVQQEHFASSLVTRRLETLLMSTPPPIRSGRIMAACPPDEQHVIPLLILSYLLRRRGWDVIYFGADVPVAQLEMTVKAVRPHLVLLAAQQLHTAATLLDMARVLSHEGFPLAYGGLVFNLVPAVRARIPGHFLGENIDSAPQVVEELMTTPRLARAMPSPPAHLLRARDLYRERQSAIELQLERNLERLPIPPDHLALANRELALNVQAALKLGSLALLGNGLDWLSGLLHYRGLPPKVLTHYLRAYRDAAARYLDSDNPVIVNWLDEIRERMSGGDE